MPTELTYDYEAIKQIIPHRPPFLLVDRVVVTDPEKSATGYKCVSGNEPYFVGHFPEKAILPGVLIVESMAQTACVLLLGQEEFKNKLAYFTGMEEVKFRKPVVPGDRLELKIEVLRMRERFGKVKGEAYVNGQLVSEAVFSCAVMDK